MPDTEPVAAGDGPSALAERDRIERALGHLPIDQRAVVVLHFHLGLSLTVAAQILDVPVGTTKSRLSRALEALRAEPEARPVTVRERAR